MTSDTAHKRTFVVALPAAMAEVAAPAGIALSSAKQNLSPYRQQTSD